MAAANDDGHTITLKIAVPNSEDKFNQYMRLFDAWTDDSVVNNVGLQQLLDGVLCVCLQWLERTLAHVVEVDELHAEIRRLLPKSFLWYLLQTNMSSTRKAVLSNCDPFFIILILKECHSVEQIVLECLPEAQSVKELLWYTAWMRTPLGLITAWMRTPLGLIHDEQVTYVVDADSCFKRYVSSYLSYYVDSLDTGVGNHDYPFLVVIADTFVVNRIPSGNFTPSPLDLKRSFLACLGLGAGQKELVEFLITTTDFSSNTLAARFGPNVLFNALRRARAAAVVIQCHWRARMGRKVTWARHGMNDINAHRLRRGLTWLPRVMTDHIVRIAYNI